MKRILRYEVPVDGENHSIFSGPVLYVAARKYGIVEFWAEVGDQTWRDFAVFGTGHDIPESYEYRGTALQGSLVWHLMEVPT